MIASIWYDWFGWPNGAVLTNLVASVIWGVFAWRKLHMMHKHIKKTHEHVTRSAPSSDTSDR